jgi:hypothetical protein
LLQIKLVHNLTFDLVMVSGQCRRVARQ